MSEFPGNNLTKMQPKIFLKLADYDFVKDLNELDQRTLSTHTSSHLSFLSRKLEQKMESAKAILKNEETVLMSDSHEAYIQLFSPTHILEISVNFCLQKKTLILEKIIRNIEKFEVSSVDSKFEQFFQIIGVSFDSRIGYGDLRSVSASICSGSPIFGVAPSFANNSCLFGCTETVS